MRVWAVAALLAGASATTPVELDATLAEVPMLDALVDPASAQATPEFCRTQPLRLDFGTTIFRVGWSGLRGNRLVGTIHGPAGVYLSARWMGPALLVASQHEFARGAYEFTTCEVVDPGEYTLRVMLIYENRSLAMPPLLPADVQLDHVLSEHFASYEHGHPLCRPLELAVSSARELARVIVPAMPPPPVVTQQCAGFGGPAAAARADDSRWQRGSDGFLDWVPRACRVRIISSDAAGKCLGTRPVLFVGDSHMERISHPQRGALGARGDKRSSQYVSLAGLTMIESAENRKEHSLAGVAPLVTHITDFFASHANAAPLVVLNFGSWELRDISAPLYLNDWIFVMSSLLAAVDACVASGRCPSATQVVWRTTPAFSYKRDLFADYEFRTNEKIQWATTRQLEYVAEMNVVRERDGRRPIAVHDTLAITLPRFSESVDTHHYLGKSKCKTGSGIGPQRTCPFGASWGNAIGLADLNALLNSICN